MCHCKTYSIAALLLLLATTLSAKETPQQSYDIFIPLGKYLAAGDEESLSAWFAPSLEMAVLGPRTNASSKQATQILKTFFKSYTPRTFTIRHQAGREGLKYALGELIASGEHFTVTIFVSIPQGGSFQIQQLRIDRQE